MAQFSSLAAHRNLNFFAFVSQMPLARKAAFLVASELGVHIKGVGSANPAEVVL